MKGGLLWVWDGRSKAGEGPGPGQLGRQGIDGRVTAALRRWPRGWLKESAAFAVKQWTTARRRRSVTAETWTHRLGHVGALWVGR